LSWVRAPSATPKITFTKQAPSGLVLFCGDTPGISWPLVAVFRGRFAHHSTTCVIDVILKDIDGKSRKYIANVQDLNGAVRIPFSSAEIEQMVCR